MNNNFINLMDYGPQLANVASVFPKHCVFKRENTHTQKTTVLKLVHMFEGLFEFAVLFEIIGSEQSGLEFCAKRP